MKKNIAIRSFLPFVIFFIVLGCKDDTVKPISTSRCTIQSENTTLVSNTASWTYEYDTDQNPVTINRFNSYGMLDYTVEVLDMEVLRSEVVSGNVHSSSTSILYDANFLETLPTQSHISTTYAGTTTSNWRTYHFHYDAKDRLVKIDEQSENVSGDDEFDLTITYDENDNVTKLFYDYTTSSGNETATISVDVYDNHPAPYAELKGAKFLLNSTWDNYDPTPLLVTLSKNNPIHFTYMANTTVTYERTMSYRYNEDGFPDLRTSTSKSVSGESIFSQAFTYACQ